MRLDFYLWNGIFTPKCEIRMRSVESSGINSPPKINLRMDNDEQI